MGTANEGNAAAWSYTALPRSPAAMKLAINSERLIPFFFAMASAALRRSPSRETLIFLRQRRFWDGLGHV